MYAGQTEVIRGLIDHNRQFSRFTPDPFVKKFLLADFGICLIEDGARSTETGEVVGPRSFMAPELEDGGQLEVSPSADLYSLGATIYEMAEGRPPFAGTRDEILAGCRSALRPPFERDDVPQALRDLVHGLLAPEREELPEDIVLAYLTQLGGAGPSAVELVGGRR